MFRSMGWTAAAVLQLTIVPAIEAAPLEPDHVILVLHGSRSGYDPGQGDDGWGYGAGGTVSYYSKQHLRYCFGVEHHRDPRSSQYATTITPITFSVEYGPRRPHRAEPYFRLGPGLYNVHVKFWQFFVPTGAIVSAEDGTTFLGLHFGTGARVRPTGRTVLELGVAMNYLFAGGQSEAPNLDTAKLLNVHAGVGYVFR